MTGALTPALVNAMMRWRCSSDVSLTVGFIATMGAPMLDTILYLEILAFIAWEAVAHFVLHNRTGHTLSNRIGWLEHLGPTYEQVITRIAVAASVIFLGVHLELFP